MGYTWLYSFCRCSIKTSTLSPYRRKPVSRLVVSGFLWYSTLVDVRTWPPCKFPFLHTGESRYLLVGKHTVAWPTPTILSFPRKPIHGLFLIHSAVTCPCLRCWNQILNLVVQASLPVPCISRIYLVLSMYLPAFLPFWRRPESNPLLFLSPSETNTVFTAEAGM